MPQKSSSNKIKKYPKIVQRNKALCKAVSIMPTYPSVNLPVAYVKSLPMIVGVVTVMVLLIMPTTRSLITEFSKNTSEHFSNRTDILKKQMAFSLESGIDSYISLIKERVEILPIDSQVESKMYMGRVEESYLKHLKYDSFSEKAHFMTATISSGFNYLK
jgi:hypothetical protein